MSLILKFDVRYENLKLLAHALKSYLRAKHLSTRDYALEGYELFGSTKRNLNYHHVHIAIHFDWTK